MPNMRLFCLWRTITKYMSPGTSDHWGQLCGALTLSSQWSLVFISVASQMLARCLLAMTSDISKEHNGSANAHLSINITKVIIRTSPKLPAPSISNPQFMRCATKTWSVKHGSHTFSSSFCFRRDRSSSFLKMPMGLTHDRFDLPRHGSHYSLIIRSDQ